MERRNYEGAYRCLKDLLKNNINYEIILSTCYKTYLEFVMVFEKLKRVFKTQNNFWLVLFRNGTEEGI